MGYSIDTSALLDAAVRWYPQNVFPSVWGFLDGMVDDGGLVAVEELLRELQRRDDAIHEWVKARKARMLVTLEDDIQLAVMEVLSEFPKLVDQRPSKNLADPFVIALAKARGLVVVSGELGGTRERPKIPVVCDHFGIRCLTLPQVFQELQAVF